MYEIILSNGKTIKIKEEHIDGFFESCYRAEQNVSTGFIEWCGEWFRTNSVIGIFKTTESN